MHVEVAVEMTKLPGAGGELEGKQDQNNACNNRDFTHFSPTSSFSPVMVAKTRHGGQTSPGKLAFKEKLVTKGTTTDALLKKLKNLHEELSVLDQDRVDTKSLDSVRKELILNSILHHKDKGVKAYAACCLADILGLYAPEAPYTVAELVDIFQFIFQQLKSGLKGTEDTYYNQYFHVLESLSTVKSVVLVCDLPNADDMMKHIFSDFFTIVRRDFSKQTESFMGDILTALLDECHTLNASVLEILMAQFMDKNAVRPLVLSVPQYLISSLPAT